MNSPKNADMMTGVAKGLMIAALSRVRASNEGELPGGRTDVTINGIPFTVYGLSPVNAIVTVRCVIDGHGYACDVGPKSGKLGKVRRFMP